MEDLSQEQIAMYKEAFETFDTGTNVISARHLGDLMRKIGYNPTDSELQNWLTHLEKDLYREIKFDEFLSLMRHIIHDEELCDLFKAFDTDGDGFISSHELLFGLVNFGEKVSEDEIAEIMRIADTDGDSLINFEEFIELLKEPVK